MRTQKTESAETKSKSNNNPSGLPVALFLLWSYREHFAGLVKPVQPQRRDTASVNSHSTSRGANLNERAIEP